jgi:hypothetical protein
MKYKVRITKAPDNVMAYGGQSGYGLDIGQRGIYDTMNESPYDSVSNTAQPVPRDQATIEAERGETMVGDFDQDGHLEHMMIAGKPHSQGGTPLNVEPGTFVFSQTKKMAMGGPILKLFGKSGKKKYTPAQIAKQYWLNKFKADMEDPVVQDDPIALRTAQMMYKNNAKKLGLLALVQEGMKGFPDGIPDIARSVMPMGGEDPRTKAMYGGYFMDGGELEKYQTKGQYPGRKISKEEFQKLDPNIWKIQGNRAVRTWSGVDAKDAIKVAGKPGSNTGGSPGQIIPGQRIPGGGPWRAPSGCDNLKYTPEDIKARPGCYNTFLNKHGFKDAPEADVLKGLDDWKRGYRPTYKPGTSGTPVEGTKDTFVCSAEDIAKGYVYNPATGKCEKPTEDGEERYFIEDPTTGGGNDGGDNDYDYGRRPFFGNSLFVGPQRERFYAAPIGAVLPDPTFYDPNRELAANAEQANITQQYLAGMGSPQSFMGNASATQGRALENSANINARYQNMNVPVANQYSNLRAGILNNILAAQANRADTLFWNNEQGNKAYRNNLRQWMNNIDRYRENEYQVESTNNLMNATNPYYDMVFGRRGASIRMKPGVDIRDMILNGTGGRGSGISTDRMKQYEQAVANYSAKNMTDAQMKPLLEAQFPELYTDVRSNARNLSDVNQGYLGMLARMGFTGAGPSSIVDR